MNYSQAGSASRTTLYVVFGVVALLAAAIMLLPKGFNNDLSKIGQGMAAVVLVHENGIIKSMDFMTLLNKVRSDYAGKVEFFVVDANSKEGQIFRQQQNVGAVILVFLSPSGAQRGTFSNSNGETELRSELDKLSLEQS